MPTRYYLRLPEPERARGGDAALSFRSQSAEGLAAELQEALRGDALFQRWRAQQDDPDAVDPALGASDPQATVAVEQADRHTDVLVTTNLPHVVLKHRMDLLIGAHWTLRDVKVA